VNPTRFQRFVVELAFFLVFGEQAGRLHFLRGSSDGNWSFIPLLPRVLSGGRSGLVPPAKALDFSTRPIET
jgi:hypothetical protein